MDWHRIVRNIFSNWTSYLVTAVVGFLLTPVVVRSLGDAGYGLWTLVLSITGYFGLLDLGIRSSVSRFLTRHLALHDARGVNTTATTALVILGAGGVVALLGTVIIATFFIDTFRVEAAYIPMARIALLIAGFNVACVLPLGIFSAVLYASERFDIVSGVTIVVEVTRAIAVTWLLSHGFGLIALALLTLTITAVQYACFAMVARSLHPQLTIGREYVDRAAAKELLGFSIYRFIWIVSNQLIFYSDALVIALFLGVASVTPYAIAGTLINYGRSIVFLLVDPLYPSAARMDAHGNIDELRRLLIVGTRLALLVSLPLCLGLVFLGPQFITLWMGAEHAASAVVLGILTIAQFASMPQYVSALVLAGMAKHRVFAYIVLAEGFTNVVLSIVLVQKMGLIGVAWGTVIPSLISNLVLVPLYTLGVVEIRLRDYLKEGYLRPVLCAVPVGAIAYGFSLFETTSWLRFAGEAVTIGGVAAVMSYFVCLYAEQRAAVEAKFWAVLRRAPAAHEI